VYDGTCDLYSCGCRFDDGRCDDYSCMMVHMTYTLVTSTTQSCQALLRMCVGLFRHMCRALLARFYTRHIYHLRCRALLENVCRSLFGVDTQLCTRYV